MKLNRAIVIFITLAGIQNLCSAQFGEQMAKAKRGQLVAGAWANNLGLVRQALAAGSPINEADNEGWTALHYAAKNGNIEMVKYLIRKDADIFAQTNEGLDPYAIATKYEVEMGQQRYISILKELAAAHAAIEKKISQAMEANRRAMEVVS